MGLAHLGDVLQGPAKSGITQRRDQHFEADTQDILSCLLVGGKGVELPCGSAAPSWPGRSCWQAWLGAHLCHLHVLVHLQQPLDSALS